jgi:uncharacterized Zn-finger protein
MTTAVLLLPSYDFDKDQEIFSESSPKSNPIDCSYCTKKFFSKQNLELHLIFQHKIFFYKCPKKDCTKSFFREEYLKEHIALVHAGRIEKPYKCTKIQKCIDKGVAFKTQAKLNQHLLRHGPKNHICNECNSAFAMKYDLEAHLRTHTGEKKYKCKIEDCDEIFISSSSRSWHEKHHHHK